MARIPEAEIERLKSEVSVERLVEASGIELKKSGKDRIGRCPFHEDDTASLVVTPAKNLWHCFGCGIGGGPIDWTMKRQGVSFRHAVELLREGIPSLAAEPGTAGSVKRSTVRSLPAPVAFDADDAQLLRDTVAYYHERLKQSPEALAYAFRLQTRGEPSSFPPRKPASRLGKPPSTTTGPCRSRFSTTTSGIATTRRPGATTTTSGIATTRRPGAIAKAIPLASMAASTRMSTSKTIPSASLTLMDSRGVVEAGIQETLYKIQGINRAGGVMVVSTPTLALFQPIRLVLQVLQPNLQGLLAPLRRFMGALLTLGRFLQKLPILSEAACTTRGASRNRRPCIA